MNPIINLLSFSANQMDSGKSTLLKSIAARFGAEYLTINGTSKLGNGEDRRFDVTEIDQFITYIKNLYRRRINFVAEIGGDAYVEVMARLKHLNWPAFVSIILYIYNIQNQHDVSLKALDEVLGLEERKFPLDRLSVILNKVTRTEITHPHPVKFIEGCLERGIEICPALIPDCKVFKIQDASNQSIWQLGQESNYADASIAALNAIIEQRPQDEITELCALKAAYYYIDLVNKVVLPPLFNHIDRMIAQHG